MSSREISPTMSKRMNIISAFFVSLSHQVNNEENFGELTVVHEQLTYHFYLGDDSSIKVRVFRGAGPGDEHLVLSTVMRMRNNAAGREMELFLRAVYQCAEATLT